LQPHGLGIFLRSRLRTASVDRVLAAVAVLAFGLWMDIAPSAATEIADLSIGYLTKEVERPPALSNLQWLQPPADGGLQGARLAIDDNNTTGRFTNQRFALAEKIVPAGGDVGAGLRELAAAGHRFVVTNLGAQDLDEILATPEAKRMLIFNAGAPDDRFRNKDCKGFLLHTVPSRAMLADALVQFLVKKQWMDWFLITGIGPEDALFADALRRAAKRFGGKIVVEKTWNLTYDARRTAEAEVPVFTQVRDYDVLAVADEAGVFGEQLMYLTWRPRLVAGTQGLVPTAWHRAVEQWGAAQLQSRFFSKAGRWMTDKDYAAWVAVRSIGEAATRVKSIDFAAIAEYLRSDAFELAGYKGRKLSYRRWNGQLRQPIPLVTPRGLVSTSPQKGFLHPRTELDTLGYDEPESACKLGQ
jgi:ABC transporter substrate binding protein (PQQ-dependent alcohol dehydrogenase system)